MKTFRKFKKIFIIRHLSKAAEINSPYNTIVLDLCAQKPLKAKSNKI
jgi:hypothetical protein